MKNVFENLTKDEYQTLKLVLNTPDFKPSDAFFDDPVIDGRIAELEKNGFVSANESSVVITELGRVAIVEYDKITKSNRKKWPWKSFGLSYQLLYQSRHLLFQY